MKRSLLTIGALLGALLVVLAGAARADDVSVVVSPEAIVNVKQPNATFSFVGYPYNAPSDEQVFVDQDRVALLQFDLSKLAGKKAPGDAVLRIWSVYGLPGQTSCRIMEITGGPKHFDRSITYNRFLDGKKDLDEIVSTIRPVVNFPREFAKVTDILIPRDVFQDLIDGKSSGLAITGVGATNFNFKGVAHFNPLTHGATLIYNDSGSPAAAAGALPAQRPDHPTTPPTTQPSN
jgi:hypothetical protein